MIYNQRERIFDAIANPTAAKGYSAQSLDEIASEAAISLQTFYTHFANKEEAILATYEVGHAKAIAFATQTLAGNSGWIEAARAGAQALLEFLASEPSDAHLACVDMLIAYPHLTDRLEEANAFYTQLLSLRSARTPPRCRWRRSSARRSSAACSSSCTTTSCAATPGAGRARRAHRLHRAHSTDGRRTGLGRRRGRLSTGRPSHSHISGPFAPDIELSSGLSRAGRPRPTTSRRWRKMRPAGNRTRGLRLERPLLFGSPKRTVDH